MDLKKHIRSIPDYPKKGILFRDITTLIKDPEAFKYTNDKIIELSKKLDFDKVSAIAFLEPNEPIKSSLNESNGLTPAKRMKRLDIISAKNTAKNGDIICLLKLLFSRSSSLKFII